MVFNFIVSNAPSYSVLSLMGLVGLGIYPSKRNRARSLFLGFFGGMPGNIPRNRNIRSVKVDGTEAWKLALGLRECASFHSLSFVPLAGTSM